MTARRGPKPRLEKHEQDDICKLTSTLGGKPHVYGTRRPKGDFQGTRQTIGVPDLWIAFRGFALFWEVKREGEDRTPPQLAFAEWCEVSHTNYGWGTYNDFCDRLIVEGLVSDKNVPHYRLRQPRRVSV